MPTEQDTLAVVFEALLEQTRAIRDVKIQIESLKQMMFEHRPAFVPAFEEQVQKVSAAPQVRELQAFVNRLEAAVRELKQSS
ncbi:MAG: hypothetical protein ACE14L_17220 [Terriglobales bacterium]